MTQKTTKVGEIVVDPQTLYLSTKPELHAEVREKFSSAVELIESKLKNEAYRQAVKATGGNAFVRVTVELIEDEALLQEADIIAQKLKAEEAQKAKTAPAGAPIGKAA